MILHHRDGTDEKVGLYVSTAGMRLRAITIESEDYRAFVKDKANLGKCFFEHVRDRFFTRLVP